MTTCQYYIKRTKKPRICSKKSSYTKSSFLAQNLSSMVDFELHLCSKHFGIVANQIRKKISHSAFFDFRYDDSLCSPQFGHNTSEWKFSQLLSILTQSIDEFNRITKASHNPESSVPSIPGVDDVVFIEEKSESEVLASKFEEAKRDGRYIDLTESTEQKSEVVELQIDCPVCLDTFSPRNIAFLQCAHTICTDCLSNIVKHNIAQQCPVCRCNF